MSDFPPSPVPAGPYDTTFVAYATNEITRISYQLFHGWNAETGELGYTIYNVGDESAAWIDLASGLPDFDLDVDKVHAFWRFPTPPVAEDLPAEHLLILYSNLGLAEVKASVILASDGTIVETFTLTDEGDGTSFLTQHPQIMNVDPGEGSPTWYIASFSEDSDKMSLFEVIFDSVSWFLNENMYNTSLGIGQTLSRQFTFRLAVGGAQIIATADQGAEPTFYEVLLANAWAVPTIGDNFSAPVTGAYTVHSTHLVDILGTWRHLSVVEDTAGFRVRAFDSRAPWEPVYSAVYLDEGFTASQFLAWGSLDETAGLASAPSLVGDRSILMSIDEAYTIFCFGPGEFHDISPLGVPIDSASIKYDFFLRHELDEVTTPQTQYFIGEGLDEFCRPIATVRFV